MPQGTYKHTTDDIQQRTGLSRHFIDKCSSKLSDLLDPYRQYGKNNQLFYDDNGLHVFDHIGQLKREGKTLPAIRERLEDELQNQQEDTKTDTNTPQNRGQNRKSESGSAGENSAVQAQLIEALQSSNEQVQKAKDEVIEAKEETITSLRQNLKLITDGRDPKEVKREHEEKIEEAAERKQKIQELRQKMRRRREREKRRQQLLAELRSLEGRWFVGNRRDEIIAELERLDRLDSEEDGAGREEE